MKLTRVGTGLAPKLHLEAPPTTTVRELQFDGTDRLYDAHFGAGVAFEKARPVFYLDQVLTEGGVQTNFLRSALDSTKSEAHALSHAYEQHLPGSVVANIVEDPLTEIGSPNHSDLKPNEMALFSPDNGSEMVEAWDGDDPPELNAPNPLETVDISANNARVGALSDVANVAMNFTDDEPITFDAPGGAVNTVTHNLTTTTQAIGIESDGGTAQADLVAVNSMAGNQMISAGLLGANTDTKDISATMAMPPAETGDQLVSITDTGTDSIGAASSLAFASAMSTLGAGLGDGALLPENGSNLVFANADALSAGSRPAIGDEFVGPFPSWTNVKTVYGAKGDGVTDDTAALQAALANVGLNGHSSVLYLPAGTYKISSTLNLAAREHISIIGEDPGTTTIKWAGPTGGTELHIDGLDYSQFSRLTFDGAGIAGVLVDQSWSGGNYFDTGNQYADDFFKDAAIGIQGGAQGGGFADTSVLRDHFSNLTTAGIITRNYNALDLSVAYSTFDHCYVGVGNSVFFPDGTTNVNGAGAFEVSNSVFRYSGQDDISIGNVASPYAVRDNYSIGSKQFIITGGSNSSAPLTISGNTIIDTTNSLSMALGNLGPNVLYDNTIRSLPSATSGPVVEALNVVALGNTFTVPSAIQNDKWVGNPDADSSRRVVEIDTKVVDPSTVNTTEPSLPGVEPNLHRPIFEVPTGSDAATIQTIINSAAAQSGNRPVVHIPEGLYLINSTITIPAGTDIQLVGDGNTKLMWAGTGSGPLLYLPGPTQATLRDLQLDGGYRPYDQRYATGLLADNIDQPGSIVYLDQVVTTYGVQTNFLVNGLDNTDIEAHDFQHLYQQDFPGSVGVKVIGGPLAAAGLPKTGSVNIYSGLSSSEMIPWDVSGGGKLLVRDLWYEGSPSPTYLHLAGSGTVTMEGLMVAYSLINQPTPTFDINNFKGDATFINDYTTGNWAVSGDGTQAHVLGVGLHEATPTSTYFSNNALPAASVGLLQSMNASDSGFAVPTPNTGTLDDTFLKDMFAQTRGEEPRILAQLPADVTDLRFFQVQVSNSGTNNIAFSAAAGITLLGSDGHDSMVGGRGNDVLNGGSAADIMAGDAGDDTYVVDNAGDVVVENAGAGNDTVLSTVNFRLSNNVERLVLQGGADLQGFGNDLANTIVGNDGNNLIDGGTGADAMSGGGGNDTYFVDNGGDNVSESPGQGNDTVFASVDYRLPANVETLVLQGGANLQGFGNNLANVIYGNGGNNLIDGGGGIDLMVGGAGDDTYFVDDPSDSCFEVAGQGNDAVFASCNYGLAADVEILVMQGNGDFQGYGSNQANTLYGNSGNNLLNGAGGPDIMIGGAGNDTYFVDNAGDRVIENPGEGTDAVFSTTNYGLPANVEALVLQGAGNLSGTGNSLANSIFGNSGDNTLDGGAGADVLTGNAGNDTFVFHKGEANGDLIVDFVGNGAAAGDSLKFIGYGAGATFSNIDATHWQVNFNGGTAHEIITFMNGASISANDVIFL
jgi:Ca2+-binding RTX toxin-like protein